MRIRTIALMAMLLAVLPQVASASELFGIWQTSGGKSRVEVKECEEYVCANIIWLQTATNAAGEPLFDRRNEAVELRDRPIMGILILKVGKIGQNLWKGRVYDPERGKTYPAEVSLARGDVLQVTGCGLGGLVCKTKNWTKVGELMERPTQMQARPDAGPPLPAGSGGALKPYPPR